jgi:hypothetical protein
MRCILERRTLSAKGASRPLFGARCRLEQGDKAGQLSYLTLTSTAKHVRQRPLFALFLYTNELTINQLLECHKKSTTTHVWYVEQRENVEKQLMLIKVNRSQEKK